jgi:TRAP-type C4-dicarboxylate transport system substrate-binding protein
MFSLADVEWMDKITEETGGQVQFETYWAGALVGMNEPVTEVSKGISDIAWVAGDYQKDGFEIEKAMRLLFYGIYDTEAQRNIYKEIWTKYPEVRDEWSSVKVVGCGQPTPYQLISTKAVRGTDDFSGMIIKAAGLNAKVLTELGAEGINLPMSEAYMALQKGTIHGVLTGWEGFDSFKFAEVAGYGTYLNQTGAPTPHRAMNLDVYNSLPSDIQQVFDDNVDYWTICESELAIEADEKGIAAANEEGVEFITLTPEELDKYNAAIETTIEEEMARLDAMGLPGTEINNEIRRLVKEYNQ